MSITIRRTWEVEGVLTDPTSVKLSDSAATYGVKRNDTNAVVVADNTAMTKTSTGIYEYTFTEPANGLTYTAQIEIVYLGQTYRFEVDLVGSTAAPSDTMGVAFTELQERVARFLFGSRTVSGLSETQQDDINDIIKDGLHSVYIAHEWSFFHIQYPITTAAGDYTYDLPADYDAIEGPFTYAPDESELYPPIPVVHESELRRRRSDDDDTARPRYAAVKTASFDDTVGSKKEVEFWPTPDGIYVLTARMRLRPTMISSTHPYPVGGEVLASVIIEACLAAAERSLEDSEGVHTAQFQKLLAAAVEKDKIGSTPDTLGYDDASREDIDLSQVQRLEFGDIIFNGTVM